jgi:hypothetical protein
MPRLETHDEDRPMQIGPLPILLIGLALVGYGAAFLRRAARAAAFSKLPATLMDLRVNERTNAGFRQSWHAVEAQFRYVVAGQAYESRRVGIDHRSGWMADPRAANALASEIRQRSTCFADSQNPHHAVLVPQMPKHRRQHYIANIVAGLLLIAVAVALAVAAA